MKKFFSQSKVLVLTMLLSVGVLTTSCGSGGAGSSNISIPGVSNSAITLNNDSVLITFVFESIQLEGGLRYNIPKYPNSYIEISPDLQSTGTLMAINLGIKDALNTSLQTLDPQTLPGGRPLPGVNGGKLPAVAFSIEKFHNMAFYIGPKLFGVFIPLHLGMPGTMLTARYYVSDARVGNISIVGEDDKGENSGLLLMLDMSTQVQTQLKKLAKN